MRQYLRRRHCLSSFTPQYASSPYIYVSPRSNPNHSHPAPININTMATIHFLLSLLLLCFSPSSAASTSTSQDQLFTAKAAAIRYWNRKVPSNLPLPPVLLSQLSPLSAADSALYSSLPAPALSSRLPAFCAAARLLCSPSLDGGRQYGDIKSRFFYNIHAVYKPKATIKSGELTGLFFRVGDLLEGRVMPMKDIRDKMPARSFLPRSIASKFPFSAAGVEETFHIPAISKLGKAVAESVAMCELPATRGESKRCPTSAEEMIDFVTSVFESGRVVAHASSGFAGRWPSELTTVLVGEVKAASGGREITPVSCHQAFFPYMVYYCHSVPNVKLYEVEILDVETKEKMGVAVATCHMDTSDWTPQHAGLQALGSAPGKTEVCHWIYEGGMVWTAADK